MTYLTFVDLDAKTMCKTKSSTTPYRMMPHGILHRRYILSSHLSFSSKHVLRESLSSDLAIRPVIVTTESALAAEIIDSESVGNPDVKNPERRKSGSVVRASQVLYKKQLRTLSPIGPCYSPTQQTSPLSEPLNWVESQSMTTSSRREGSRSSHTPVTS
uniref:Uncharacterized protein n=1 Tax=Timema bartmani TaxID=61472 RepID=A0A7R9I366_9NEOP|nr:unnamed protein product [Timema bartmani]